VTAKQQKTNVQVNVSQRNCDAVGQRLAMSRSSQSVAPLHGQILLGFSNKPEALAMMPHATLYQNTQTHVTHALLAIVTIISGIVG